MKLISWNVNGIRAVLKKGFIDFLELHQPDMILLQEVKATPDQVEVAFEEAGWDVHWNPAMKKGYSGVATFSKVPVLSSRLGIGSPGHDQEGRVVTTEHDDFFVVNVYTPNSQDDLRRLPYRIEWNAAFLSYVKELEKTQACHLCRRPQRRPPRNRPCPAQAESQERRILRRRACRLRRHPRGRFHRHLPPPPSRRARSLLLVELPRWGEGEEYRMAD